MATSVPLEGAPPQGNAEQKQFDENGDEIKCEGICNRRSIAWEIFWKGVYGVAISILIGTFIFIPICIIIYFTTVKKWKLYLTSKGIYHIKPGACGCCSSNWFIPLQDIEDIFITPGTTHTLWVKMDPSKINDYISWNDRPLCEICGKANCLVLDHVKNAEEFVSAVKAEMSAA